MMMSRHLGLREEQLGELVDRRGARPVAEADHHQVAAEMVDVAALEGVVHPPLRRAVVEQAGVLEQRVMAENRLHDDRLGPADRVAHRADEDVVAGDHAAVAREKQIRQRRQDVRALIERPGQRTGRLFPALDEHFHEAVGIELADVAGQRLRRHDVHRLADQQLAGVGVGENVGEEIADLIDGREPLEDRDEALVLLAGRLAVDDVVVEVLDAVARSHGIELDSRRVDDHAAEPADF